MYICMYVCIWVCVCMYSQWEQFAQLGTFAYIYIPPCWVVGNTYTYYTYTNYIHDTVSTVSYSATTTKFCLAYFCILYYKISHPKATIALRLAIYIYIIHQRLPIIRYKKNFFFKALLSEIAGVNHRTFYTQ